MKVTELALWMSRVADMVLQGGFSSQTEALTKAAFFGRTKESSQCKS